jgi:hypothetical protein
MSPDEVRLFVQSIHAILGYYGTHKAQAERDQKFIDELRRLESVLVEAQSDHATHSDAERVVETLRADMVRHHDEHADHLDVLLGALTKRIGDQARSLDADIRGYLHVHHQHLLAKLAELQRASAPPAPAKLDLPPLRRRSVRTWGAPPEGLEASERGLVVPRCSLGPLGGEVATGCKGVAFLGDLVAVATRKGQAGRITLWSMKDGRPLDLDEIRDDFSREGLVAAASAEVALVHSHDLKPSAVLDGGRLRVTGWADAGPYTAIRLTPDGRHALAGRHSWEGTHVVERAVADGSVVRQFAFTEGDPVQAVDVSLDGRVVAAAGAKLVRAWDRGTGRVLLEAAGAVQPQVAVDATGVTVVVAGGASGTRPTDVRCHRTDTGAVVWSVSGLPGSVDALAMGACDRVVVVVTREVNPDRIQVYVLDHETGRERDRWSLTPPPGLRSFGIQRSVTNGTSDLLAFVLGDRVVVLEIASRQS